MHSSVSISILCNLSINTAKKKKYTIFICIYLFKKLFNNLIKYLHVSIAFIETANNSPASLISYFLLIPVKY